MFQTQFIRAEVRQLMANQQNQHINHLLQIGARFYYKLGQLCVITNWDKCYYKLGQLSYYKMGHTLLQIEATITNQGNRYYKLGQLLQIGAIITNLGITMVTASIRIVFQNQFVANQDGNFNMKRNLHFVIIDHHCTLLTILLHGSIPESNQIIRIEIVESNVLINRSTVVTSFKFFIIGGEIRKLYHGSV